VGNSIKIHLTHPLPEMIQIMMNPIETSIGESHLDHNSKNPAAEENLVVS